MSTSAATAIFHMKPKLLGVIVNGIITASVFTDNVLVALFEVDLIKSLQENIINVHFQKCDIHSGPSVSMCVFMFSRTCMFMRICVAKIILVRI